MQDGHRPGVAPIPASLLAKLNTVPGSFDQNGYEYRPCCLTLRAGTVHPGTYVQEYSGWHNIGTIEPFAHGLSWVAIEDVMGIEESPERFPPAVATAINKRHEVGMGFKLFSIETADGASYPYVGYLGDFLELPDGVDPKDVVAITDQPLGMHQLPRKARLAECRHDAEFEWCIYEGVDRGR